MNAWAVEALAVAAEALQGRDRVGVIHERSNDARSAQSSGD
jgi:hypothetical protein